MDQVLIRLIDFKTILYYHFRSKIYKKRIFIDRSDFKTKYENNENIELNIFNKLFIIIGKNYSSFFYYDFDQNEVFKLSDCKFSHYCGNMIYVPLNNSIYALGGFNSKLCESYRNDQLFFSNKAKENPGTLDKNRCSMSQWMQIAELNIVRQESSTALINNYLYIFFGYNVSIKINNNTIERIDVLKNDKWDYVNILMNSHELQINSQNLNLNSNGIIPFGKEEILIIGGYDGKSYRDSIYILSADKDKNSNLNKLNNNDAINLHCLDLDLFCEKIPEITKNVSYIFDKESLFINIQDYENIICEKMYDYAMFDSKLRLHLVNTRKFRYDIIRLTEI